MCISEVYPLDLGSFEIVGTSSLFSKVAMQYTVSHSFKCSLLAELTDY